MTFNGFISSFTGIKMLNFLKITFGYCTQLVKKLVSFYETRNLRFIIVLKRAPPHWALSRVVSMHSTPSQPHWGKKIIFDPLYA
jgi:hypothetical protein